mgnify:CR=1 FL=1
MISSCIFPILFFLSLVLVRQVPCDELVTRGLTDYTVKYELDKERGVYVIGAMKKE